MRPNELTLLVQPVIDKDCPLMWSPEIPERKMGAAFFDTGEPLVGYLFHRQTP